jgi:hypothetical protein
MKKIKLMKAKFWAFIATFFVGALLIPLLSFSPSGAIAALKIEVRSQKSGEGDFHPIFLHQ